MINCCQYKTRSPKSQTLWPGISTQLFLFVNCVQECISVRARTRFATPAATLEACPQMEFVALACARCGDGEIRLVSVCFAGRKCCSKSIRDARGARISTVDDSSRERDYLQSRRESGGGGAFGAMRGLDGRFALSPCCTYWATNRFDLTPRYCNKLRLPPSSIHVPAFSSDIF